MAFPNTDIPQLSIDVNADCSMQPTTTTDYLRSGENRSSATSTNIPSQLVSAGEEVGHSKEEVSPNHKNSEMSYDGPYGYWPPTHANFNYGKSGGNANHVERGVNVSGGNISGRSVNLGTQDAVIESVGGDCNVNKSGRDIIGGDRGGDGGSSYYGGYAGAGGPAKGHTFNYGAMFPNGSNPNQLSHNGNANVSDPNRPSHNGNYSAQAPVHNGYPGYAPPSYGYYNPNHPSQGGSVPPAHASYGYYAPPPPPYSYGHPFSQASQGGSVPPAHAPHGYYAPPPPYSYGHPFSQAPVANPKTPSKSKSARSGPKNVSYKVEGNRVSGNTGKNNGIFGFGNKNTSRSGVADDDEEDEE